MRTRRHSAGFTLLEVLTTSALMMVLLAIAAPNLRGLRAPYAMRAATQQIEADLMAIRMRAIARNDRYRIAFSANNYQIERETAPNVFTLDSGPVPLPSGVSIGTVSPGNPVFDTRGLLAADVTVPVMVAGGTSRTVTVNVLGRTTVN